MDPDEPDDELDIPDEPNDADEVRRRAGWPTAGPGRPGPGEMAYRRAYDLSLARWGDGGRKREDRNIGSVRWVQQKLAEDGYGLKPIPTVQRWIKRGKQIRDPELKWLRDPLNNRDKITNEAHQVIGMVFDEYETGEISQNTKDLVALLGGGRGMLALLADVTGAKAATAIEIAYNTPAGMSEAHVAKLRATDPAAMTDAERRDMRAAYDTRRRNGTGPGGAGSRHADPDHHGPVTQ